MKKTILVRNNIFVDAVSHNVKALINLSLFSKKPIEKSNKGSDPGFDL